MSDIAAEILRAISSPYAVSLKELHSTLKLCEADTLQTWADTHPCQIKALARTAVEALDSCPFALSTLEIICYVAAVRDQILKANGTLLDSLLRKALQDQNNFEKYSPACLSLLSSPLPPPFARPAPLVSFFLKTVEVATKVSSVDSLKGVHLLVSKGCSDLSSLLSQSQNYDFQKKLSKFLSVQDSNTNTFLILSLATLALMAEAMGAGGVEGEDDISRPKADQFEFFRGKRATKVLDLVSNIVIELASKDTMDWEISRELIRMALVIVDTISFSVKNEDARKAMNTRKLLEKTSRSEMDPRVVEEILRFVAALHSNSPVAGLPESLEKIARKSFNGPTSEGQIFLPSSLAETIATGGSDDFVLFILQSSIRLASTSSTSGTTTTGHYLQLRKHLDLVQKLNGDAVLQFAGFRKAVLSALKTKETENAVSTLLKADLNKSAQRWPCPSENVCPWTFLELQRKLSLELCSVILRCSLYTDKHEPAHLDSVLADKILKKQMELAAIRHYCTSDFTPPFLLSSQKQAFFETAATPNACVRSWNWRESLLTGLQREAGRQEDFIIAAVGDICRDLESRCKSVEGPLRSEEAKSQQLQSRIDELTTMCRQAEDETDRYAHLYDELTEERGRTELRLEGMIGRMEDLQETVQKLEQKLQDARTDITKTREENDTILSEQLRSYETTLRDVEDRAKESEIEHTAICTEQQAAIRQLEELRDRQNERLEQQREEINTVQQQANKTIEKFKADLDTSRQLHDDIAVSLRDEIARIEYQKAEVDTKIRIQQMDIETTNKELQSQVAALQTTRAKLEAVETVVKAATEREDALKKILEDLETTERSLKRREEELTVDLKRTKEHNERAYEELKAEHESSITLIKNTHAHALEALQFQLSQTCSDLSREREEKQSEIQTFKLRISNLRHQQEEKEREAQNLTRKLLSVVSNTGDFCNLDVSSQTLSSPKTSSTRKHCEMRDSPASDHNRFNPGLREKENDGPCPKRARLSLQLSKAMG